VPEESPSDPLTDRLTEVVDAGLQLGASLARRLAELTGSPEQQESGVPVDDLVRFGSEAAGNVLGLVAAGARTGINLGARASRAVTPERGAGQPAAQTRTQPMVTRGSTLRVPLLVENTGQTPTRPLTFATTSLLRAGCPDSGDCTCLPVDTVSFAPETLVVAAHDFEKLTVRIAVPSGAAPGGYTASITAGDGWFSTTIGFSVLPAAGE
jgi:hypothetical protein